MKITEETVGPCRLKLYCVLAPEEVDPIRRRMVRDIAAQAKVPGFRPGRVPPDIVEKKFPDEVRHRIRMEVTRHCLDEVVRRLGRRYLRTVDLSTPDGVDFAGPTETAITVEVEPDFTLPDYRGIPVRAAPATVPEAEVEAALANLRARAASYRNVAGRPAQAGDLAQVDAEGLTDGRPIDEISPQTRGLGRLARQWVALTPDAFPPGLGPALEGAAPGETRTVAVEFPTDFAIAELAGRKAEYRVTLLALQEPVLPELDEAFCRAHGATDPDDLRRRVRESLQRRWSERRREEMANQIADHLLVRTPMDLPESLVQEEARRLAALIVRRGLRQGLSEEAIRGAADRIEQTAQRSARETAKLSFIMERIAAQEGIAVSDEDLNREIARIARAEGVPPDDLARRLREAGALETLRRRLASEMVTDRLIAMARVEEAAS